MRGTGADTPEGSDRRFEELRSNLTTLTGRLAKFEAHPGTRLAREGDGMSGDSRTQWLQAEAKVAQAHQLKERARQRERQHRPDQPWTNELSGILADLRQAKTDVENAILLAARVATVRTDYDHRVRVVQANAKDAGEAGTLAEANDLLHLIETRPLERQEGEVEQLEERAVPAALYAAIRVQARLLAARFMVQRAAVRIAGYDPGPLPELDDLVEWLDRIRRGEHDSAESSASQQLARWRDLADMRGKPILAAEPEARARLYRRRRLRGQFKALREKAWKQGRSEEPEVGALLRAVADELWTAPTDLAVAEARLLRLGNLLNEP